jgi:uncharacterized protein (TIGR00304 family)
MMIDQTLINIGFSIILIGFALAFIAAILMIAQAAGGREKIKGGGAVIVGPFPIVFGTDRESVKILLVLSIALIALMLAAMLIPLYAMK